MTSTLRFDRWENPDASESVTFDQLAGGTGLVPIVAPTVNFSGGTATANTAGEVTFTGVTSISLNNVFSADYTNYKVIISKGLVASSINAELSMRLRNSGTNRTSSYYMNGVLQLGSAAPAASQISNTDRYVIGNLANSNYNSASLEFHSPSDASSRTSFNNIFYGLSGSVLYLSNAGIHDVAQAHDGFTITVGAGNITGAVAIYGYKI
jgi:hypothetical protein